MKYNLLVWCSHSCRRDVFLEELDRGNLPHYRSVLENGAFFPNAVVGGHYQLTSNVSEITGRVVTSTVPVSRNLLNAAKEGGAYVGVVDDGAITMGVRRLVERNAVSSLAEVYPNLISQPRIRDFNRPRIEFFPDVSHRRWLYWYRERSTHRNFYNLALSFEHDGGVFERVVNDNPRFVRDQQRYSLWLQDRWFGSTLEYLAEKKALADTIIVVFSSHGTSLEGWIPLVGKVTKASVDHGSENFHPQVSRSFAFLSGPGIPKVTWPHWISIMDLKPTLCRLLGIEDQGGSAYSVDLLGANVPGSRILADVSSRVGYSLFHPTSGWLLISTTPDRYRPQWTTGLPGARYGMTAFNVGKDPLCARPRTGEFLRSAVRDAFSAEVERLGLSLPSPLRAKASRWARMAALFGTSPDRSERL